MTKTRATRPPTSNGTLYPALPERLRSDVDRLLGEARAPRRSVGVLAPHSGFAYSGATDGAVFGAVEVPATCVVLGANHRGRAIARDWGSVLLETPYRTPLGDVMIDAELGLRLMVAAGSLLEEDAVAHAQEHSVEVVLPFLQVRNPEVHVVPILIGWDDWERTRRLARALDGAIGGRRDVLVVASSDLNHLEPLTVTKEKDALVLDRLVALDGRGLLEVTHSARISMCGRAAAACACEVARLRGATRGEVVAYGHSGLAGNDREAVTGFAGALLGTDAPAP
jgi:AmmeMemoRadiSam system protein B